MSDIGAKPLDSRIYELNLLSQLRPYFVEKSFLDEDKLNHNILSSFGTH